MPTAPRANALTPHPTPRSTIRLSDAFERYYRTTSPDAAAIEADLNAALPGHESTETMWKRWNAAYDARDKSRSEAERSFRKMLATGHPVTLICDPTNGKTWQLDYKEWNKKMNFGVPGFSDDDFVGPDDLMQPGPSTIVNGVACSVFLDLDEFQSLLGLGQVDGAKTGTAGRPTSKHLCIQEMERRYAADKMDARVSHEARALREWLAVTHPKEPQPGAATLENSIRGRHRELKSHKTIP